MFFLSIPHDPRARAAARKAPHPCGSRSRHTSPWCRRYSSKQGETSWTSPLLPFRNTHTPKWTINRIVLCHPSDKRVQRSSKTIHLSNAEDQGSRMWKMLSQRAEEGPILLTKHDQIDLSGFLIHRSLHSRIRRGTMGTADKTASSSQKSRRPGRYCETVSP